MIFEQLDLTEAAKVHCFLSFNSRTLHQLGRVFLDFSFPPHPQTFVVARKHSQFNALVSELFLEDAQKGKTMARARRF